MVHLSDISWDLPGEEAIREYKKGDEIETVILSVDPERERISLGIKQLSDDPFINYVAVNEKGTLIKGTVTEVDAKGAVLELSEGVEATLKASEISRDRVEDASKHLAVGDEIEAKITGIDRKNRIINLSIKAKDESDEKQAMKDLRSQEPTEESAPKTIGDLIKAQMGDR